MTGGTDCHVHIIGDATRYPMQPDRAYTPGPADVAGLQSHLTRLGLDRAVVVQPSVYGTDNHCLVDALGALGPGGRGVAVVSPSADEAVLAPLDDAGVRGIRLNLESQGEGGLVQALAPWMPLLHRIGRRGWHLQIYASAPVLAEAAAALAALPVPVVLDHFAMLSNPTWRTGATAAALHELLAGGNAWLKLSAPYRVLARDETLADLATWVPALVSTRPDRMLWGSDWPHTQRESGIDRLSVSRYRDEDAALALAQLSTWAPGCVAQILVDNPAALYGW